MENKAYALRAGLFTVLLLLAALAAGLWLNKDRQKRLPYELATKLSIPGLNEQATVRYRGLNVGRVDRITFDPQVPGQILVRISVRPDTPITASTFGMLAYQGVTGIAYVQLNDDGTSPVRLQTSRQQVARIQMRPSLLNTLESQGMAILVQVEQLTRRMNAVLNEENEQALKTSITKLNAALDQFERIPRQLQPTLSRLPALADNAQSALRSAEVAATRFADFGNALQAQNGPIDRFGRSVDEVAAVAYRLERDLVPLSQEFRSTMRLFNRTLENVNDRPQSLLFGAGNAPPGPGEPGFDDKAR